MIINYLKDAKNLQELKKLYFKLAKQLHPDITKDDGSAMQRLNNEYDYLKNILKNDAKVEKDFEKETVKTMDDFKDILSDLLKYKHITIEIIGSWLWISGIGTYAIKDNILYGKYQCRFSKAQKKFYWYSGISRDNMTKYRGGHIQKAINRYGVITLDSEPLPQLA